MRESSSTTYVIISLSFIAFILLGATVANHRDTCARPSQDELKQELAELEQEELDEKLMADHAPVHHPAGPSRVEDSACPYCVPLTSRMLITTTSERQAVEDDEEAQLKELQAALAM